MNLIELTDAEFAKYRDLIYRVSGIRIGENKRVLISNRVRRRLRATGIAGYSAYFDFIRSAAGQVEMQPFLDAVTTNETYFFRDAAHYQWLADEFLPGMVREAAARRRPRTLRFWSAACSTGEEPYSMALKVAGRKGEFAGWRVEIVGTDLSASALTAARAAVYDERALHRVDPADRKAFFDEAPAGRWTVKPEVRAMASFRSHNLLFPTGGEPFDCIFLKNVLIYFDAVSKQKVVDVILAALAKGGSLVIGPTEGIHGMLGGLEKLKPWLYRKGS
ncbi:CheR family methyltransferase [Paludisphaera mucosa]|uniref:protein-glutamate O-methyltransferase n=1 Tax=Paludisphaera mucosa TaxID=3030827 RepID=A0ABT6FKY6_9BACT|nr:protein-glutamate O-methyltransferase CheR [Paludisphaera mucosa]MDG3008241.1 protein-glutamate O-methyltransferase CheR [Paludisphaera mucosa]